MVMNDIRIAQPRRKKNLKRRRILQRIGIGLLILILVCVVFSILLMWRFARIEAKKPEVLGVTFSQVQAERFGSDWRANYIATLDELGFRHLRLIAYWDRTEPEQGKYNFNELDWMLAVAKERGAHVTLEVGQRGLRYPECFYPSWVNSHDPAVVKPAVNAYTKTVVDRYKNNSTIEAWQLENEFLLHSFGQCPKQNMNSTALQQELTTLRSVDKIHPVVITASNEFGLPILGPVASDFGFSMYKVVWNQLTHRSYFTYPQPGMYNWWRASMVSFFRGQNIRIHELQAEPWGPVGNEKLSPTEAARSMTPALLKRNLDYARSTRIRRIDLWGVEWWWYMKTHYKDDAMWQAVKALPNKY